jgi:hypothetical protein
MMHGEFTPGDCNPGIIFAIKLLRCLQLTPENERLWKLQPHKSISSIFQTIIN